MIFSYSLKQFGCEWRFDKESEFEDFMWRNLEELLQIKPFKRQYYVKGQFCDILGTGQNKELVILELKINEDRYIVQQLTRYYDAIVEEKPFATEIDYSQKIKLIGIVPSVHKDSCIDVKYNILDIVFMCFSLQEINKKLYFQLKDNLSNSRQSLMEIIPKNEVSELSLPEIPKKLKQILSKATELEQIGVDQMRKQLLSFHKKMVETVVSESIIYQFNKSSPVAEIRFDDRRNQLALFLWLPLSTSQSISLKIRRIVVRMRIWTNWETVSHLGYIRQGNGIMITDEELKTFPIAMIPASLLPFKKRTSRFKTFESDLSQRFENDLLYREKYTQSIVNRYSRADIYYHQHGEALALSVHDYIRLFVNLKHKKNALFLSEVMNLDSPDLTLKKFIELALNERFLSLNKSH